MIKEYILRNNGKIIQVSTKCKYCFFHILYLSVKFHSFKYGIVSTLFSVLFYQDGTKWGREKKNILPNS